jgi:chromate reductase
MPCRYTVLLVCGSLRRGSVNEAVLRTAQQVSPDRVAAELYAGMGDLPHFNPDDDRPETLHPAVVDLRARIGAADAMLFCTPEYAGAMPGSFKNVLDWTVGGGETYGKPVGWINASVGPTDAVDTYDSLRKVLERTGTDIVETACVRIPVGRPQVGPDGTIADEEVRARLALTLTALADHLSA